MGLPGSKPPLSIQHQRFSKQGSVAKPFTVTLIVFLVFLLPLGATQNNGITLYDDANLDANENNITGLDTLNFSSTGQSRILNFFDQDRCADDEAIKTIYPNGSYSCNSINTTTAAEGLPDTLEQNRTATLDIDTLRNALVSSNGGVRLGDGQGSVNTRGGLQVTGRYDVATARSDGSFDVSGRDSRPLGLDWSSDGSKLYFVGDGGDNDNVYEYTASTAFDASTASFSTSMSVSGEDSIPTGIAWSGDGSKLFMVGRGNANVYEYTASIPFDLSTASYEDSFDISPQDSTPRGISISGDGTELIVGGDGTETVYGYTLSTPNDISTASVSGSHDISSEEANARGVAWGAEGTRLFVAGENSGSVYEYTVSTPYSLDTAEFDESFSVSSEDSQPSGLSWDSNGSQLYVSGLSNGAIQQYRLASGDTDFRGGSLENSIGNLSVADNLSIEGDLNLTGDSLYNFFNQSGCSSGRVIDQIYPDGSYSCISVDSVSSVEGLPATLDENNTANQEIDLDQNNISNIANLENFFEQTQCADDEAIKTVYPNGSYECNSISTTTDSENLSETLSAGNSVGEYSIDTGDQNITSSEGNVSIGSDLRVYGNIWTQGEVPADTLSEVLGAGNTANMSLDMDGNSIDNPDEIQNFFDQSQCADDEAVKTVYPNGSYECNSISTTTETENLSETLAAGNIANQTINFESGIQIGDSGTSTSGGDQIAVGKDATASGNYGASAFGENSEASGDRASAFGRSSEASGGSASAFGPFSEASGLDASAFGRSSEASGSGASAFGYGSVASAEGAVAIGNAANAPNQYEATFGNLDDDQLDVNVTGDLTVHGEDLDLRDGDIENFFNQTQCADDEAIKTIYPNGSYSCNTISQTTQTEGLSETLAAGNVANQTIRFEDGVQIGDGSTSTGESDSVAIGKGASAQEYGSIAIGRDSVSHGLYYGVAVGREAESSSDATSLGYQAVAGSEALALGGESDASNPGSLALGHTSTASNNYAAAIGHASTASGDYAAAIGYSSTASSEGAVAIGREAVAPKQYEATFGNLDGEELDVNVTGDLTVHGEDLDLRNGDIENFFDQSQCADDEAIKTVYPNGSYECNTISQTTGTENLNETLAAGSSAGDFDINMSNQEVNRVGSVAVASRVPVVENDSFGFEDGSLSPFDSSGDSSWGINDSVSSQGEFSAESGNITDDELSVLTLVENTPGGVVHFSYGTSTEEGYDYLKVYLNGTQVFEASGFNSFTNTSVSVPPGTVNLTWVYDKDGRVSGGNDKVFIDNVRVPEQTGERFEPESINITGESIIFDQGISIGDSETYTDGGIAIGEQSSSFRDNTIAIGSNSSAVGINAAAFGPDSDASGDRASAFGPGSDASGDWASAFGEGSEASADSASAFGGVSNASGYRASAFGLYSKASAQEASAFGHGSYASSLRASAFGSSSYASGDWASAFGHGSYASSLRASAFGFESWASANYSMALTPGGDFFTENARAEGSVAIGREAIAPNSYEATFGNLDDDRLDLNVTGNLTVHGEDLDLRDGDIENFFDQTQCADDEAIKTVYPNGSYECNTISQTTGTENLSETLAAGNVMNQSIDLASGQAVEIGTGVSTNITEDVAIGRSTEASGTEDFSGDPAPATAVGHQATAAGEYSSAFGRGSEASADSASAFGGDSEASAYAASAVGYGSEASGEYASAVGWRSTASGYAASAFGRDSEASGGDASAFGRLSDASGDNAAAVGYYSWASADYSMALTPDGDFDTENARAEGSVAIGRGAIAPNQYEATFGNLDGDELDVNITGDLTVHGDQEVTGSKNFVHEINQSHEAVYTSQESPDARAVYEGNASVEAGETKVDLPHHFKQVVSDSRPELRVQVTPIGGDSMPVRVINKSQNGFVVEQAVGDPESFSIDYRITGIRDGYEDKQAVREN